METHDRGRSNAERRVMLAAVLLFAAALAGTLARGIANSAEPFDYPHAFVSADVATTARTFATVGVWRLHGVPVDNNPPIGRGDLYTHWPPLLPILLSACFRVFGASERVAHLFILAVVLGTALLVYRVGQRWLGTAGGALAGFFFLTLPVTVHFGHVVSHQLLMTLLMTAAVLALMQGRTMLGAGLMFVGALTSWEIVLVSPGLLLAAGWRPELRRQAVAATVGAVAGVACVGGWYLIQSPSLAVDSLQTLKFYMGLSTTYSHVLPSNIHEALSPMQQVRRMLLNNVWMLGPLGLGAALQLFGLRVRMGMVAALAAPWLLWCVLLRDHMARHPFEFAIAAPFVALALAWMATAPSKQPMLRAGALAALAVVQLLLLPRPRANDQVDAAALIRYAQGIRQFTQPNAVVLTPLASAVPLYYSERHIVRGVTSEAAIAAVLPGVRQQFGASAVYVAVPPDMVGAFAQRPVAGANADVVVWQAPAN